MDGVAVLLLLLSLCRLSLSYLTWKHIHWLHHNYVTLNSIASKADAGDISIPSYPDNIRPVSWEIIYVQEGFNDVKMFVSWFPLSVKAYVTLPSAGVFSPAQEIRKTFYILISGEVNHVLILRSLYSQDYVTLNWMCITECKDWIIWWLGLFSRSEQ